MLYVCLDLNIQVIFCEHNPVSYMKRYVVVNHSRLSCSEILIRLLVAFENKFFEFDFFGIIVNIILELIQYLNQSTF